MNLKPIWKNSNLTYKLNLSSRWPTHPHHLLYKNPKTGREEMILTVTSDGLKRNCLLRFDFSMVSMSVTMTSPSPAASPTMAKFFSSSQPIAPAPTWRDKASHWVKTFNSDSGSVNCWLCVFSLVLTVPIKQHACNTAGQKYINMALRNKRTGKMLAE